VPFIRQTRDKRGFEHTYVMHTYHQNAGQRPRVLYLFRTPSNLRVGRKPLDAEVTEALEHTHPDLSFDWTAVTRDTIHSVPEPSPEGRRWQGREDRRPHQRPAQRPSTPPAAPEDASILGRTVGAGEAARLRQRFSQLTQRIQSEPRHLGWTPPGTRFPRSCRRAGEAGVGAGIGSMKERQPLR
jgi:hypothetical protein